jgi:hypothetical protein
MQAPAEPRQRGEAMLSLKRRVRGFWIALVAAGLLASAPSTARAAVTVVYPTGQFPADVTNVQAALDQGGTVLLKATDVQGQPTAFDFGPSQLGSGVVNVRVDAALTGERAGEEMTTIEGGSAPVRVRPGVNVTISGIDFERPGNTFVGNNIARFTASFADVFFDEATHDTVLAGFSGSVVDLGTVNRITPVYATGR